MGWVRRLTKGRLQILDVPQVFSSSMSAHLHSQVLWEGSTFMHLHLLWANHWEHRPQTTSVGTPSARPPALAPKLCEDSALKIHPGSPYFADDVRTSSVSTATGPVSDQSLYVYLRTCALCTLPN